MSRGALLQDGYVVSRNCLGAGLLDVISDTAGRAVASLDAVTRAGTRSQGSLINVADYPVFASLIGAPALEDLFGQLEFDDPRFGSGYIISKPPGGPPLFWHQDWWGWDEPSSYDAAPAQVFAMIYLSRTTRANGCLRVVPGSHRRRHWLHEAAPAHADALSRVERPDDPVFQSCADEVDVPVSPGDVVIGDARLLHGAHANTSDAERSLVTLWFMPSYRTLTSAMQARVREIYLRRGVDTDAGGADAMTLDDWPSEARARIAHLLPAGPGDGVAPHPWNREPDLPRLGRVDAEDAADSVDPGKDPSRAASSA